MHTPDLFLARAAECEAMAKTAHEPDSRAIWTRMAQRWQRCAEVEIRASTLALHQQHDRQRKSPSGWSRY